MATRKLKLIGAKLRYFDTRAKEGIVFHRLHLTACLTPVLARNMGWESALFPDGQGAREGWEEMKLDGALSLQGLSMEADGLKQSFDISATNCGAFVGYRDGGELLIDFVVRTEDRAAAIEEFWRLVGDAASALVLKGAAEQKTITEDLADQDAEAEAARGPLTKVKG